MITIVSSKGKVKTHVHGELIELMADFGVAAQSVFEMFRGEGEDAYNLFKEIMYPEGGMPDWLAKKDEKEKNSETDIDALEDKIKDSILNLEQIVEDLLNANEELINANLEE